MGLAPAVFGPLMNITGSILASYWHERPIKAEAKAQIDGELTSN
jgi:BASS family bile acid:Na+ symporter